MLARRDLPEHFKSWNKRWGAPFGHPNKWGRRFWKKFLSANALTRLEGPFSIQRNTENRVFEYPWAFYAIPIEKGMRIVDLGGGLAGFQFVLSASGAHVLNVDPGFEAEGVGWKCDRESIERMNNLFGTKVQLENRTILEASLDRESIDVVYSISVIEHFSEDEFWETVEAVWDCLKVGGKFVVTIDLFLNLFPFSSRKTNVYGTNFPIGKLDGFRTFSLVSGEKRELFGTDEFNKDHILSNLETYCIGTYPAMAQCLILQKD